ncbi:PAAR domain-containing protein [Cellulosimicrobium marinum]|uniref:PAAR domain-containing protein n=1 Tax=Cellulosimicrobium marinum TaxID=1638992 RepID=UPI001E368A2D|nr:PAAR domain-containing protein [Cellulosimicrobium marinum]MCB7135682.1 PAAR domain-containing protein [Cellulosimicrobium marinum]
MPTGPAVCAGDQVVCPLVDGVTPHVGGPITPAACVATVLAGNRPVAVANGAGVVCASPAPNGIAVGSVTVLAGGLPVARLGDTTVHGGTVIGPGCPTVVVGG